MNSIVIMLDESQGPCFEELAEAEDVTKRSARVSLVIGEQKNTSFLL